MASSHSAKVKRSPGESYSKVALQCAGSHRVHRTAVFFEVEHEMNLFSMNRFHLNARFAAQMEKPSDGVLFSGFVAEMQMSPECQR